MIRSIRFSRRVLFPLYGGCILLVLLGAVTAQGATYYVATTGSDANPGTSDRPWRNPQNCVDADSPLVAGDICEVANGTYTSTTTGRVVLVSSSSPAGQPGKPITIRSATPLGAHIVIPNSWSGANCDVDACPYTGILITQPYYVVEGFDISRPGSSFGNQAAIAGISLEGANNTVIRRNRFHDIGRTVCHNGLLGMGESILVIPRIRSLNTTNSTLLDASAMAKTGVRQTNSNMITGSMPTARPISRFAGMSFMMSTVARRSMSKPIAVKPPD